MTLVSYLLLASIVFGISVAGLVINRKNLLIVLMCIEMMLLAVCTNFVAVVEFLGHMQGEVFVFFILTVAASESAIGLALLVLLYRQRGTILVEDLKTLRG